MLETGGSCGAVAFLGKVENVAIFPKLYIQILYIKVYSKCFLPVLLAFAQDYIFYFRFRIVVFGY